MLALYLLSIYSKKVGSLSPRKVEDFKWISVFIVSLMSVLYIFLLPLISFVQLTFSMPLYKKWMGSCFYCYIWSCRFFYIFPVPFFLLIWVIQSASSHISYLKGVTSIFCRSIQPLARSTIIKWLNNVFSTKLCVIPSLFLSGALGLLSLTMYNFWWWLDFLLELRHIL